MQFTVVAIPLNRPEIVEFLAQLEPEPRGASVSYIAQRPLPEAEYLWVKRLGTHVQATTEDLLRIDNPHNHLVQTWTDWLVPVEFSREPGFLTRNQGGRAPIYFGVIEVAGTAARTWQEDPLLQHARRLTVYGSQIKAVGADPEQVSQRAELEIGEGVDGIVKALRRIHGLRQENEVWPRTTPHAQVAYIDKLYAELDAGDRFGGGTRPPLPPLLLWDELLGQLVNLEGRRREALARGQIHEADVIGDAQRNWRKKSGLTLILQGEHIVGRHHRSTTLLAPELDVVVKQPAPEPLHEIVAGAESHDGQPENWPQLLDDGALVTARGRIRLLLEEGVVPLLSQAFRHKIKCSTLLGVTVEPFVHGETLEEYLLADPTRLSLELYEELVFYQQVCEQLGVENAFWESGNFLVRAGEEALLPLDWTAVRPLAEERRTKARAATRLQNVQSIAYSFADERLTEQIVALHEQLVSNADRLAGVQRRADRLLRERGLHLPR